PAAGTRFRRGQYQFARLQCVADFPGQCVEFRIHRVHLMKNCSPRRTRRKARVKKKTRVKILVGERPTKANIESGGSRTFARTLPQIHFSSFLISSVSSVVQVPYLNSSERKFPAGQAKQRIEGRQYIVEHHTQAAANGSV